jgi:hypothetical protein
MAKTKEERQAASAALAGAQQFQESWRKFYVVQAAASSANSDAAGVPIGVC